MPPGFCQELSPEWKHEVHRDGAQLFKVSIETPLEMIGSNDFLQFFHSDSSPATERFTAQNWPDEPVLIESAGTLAIKFFSDDWAHVAFKCSVTIVCTSNLKPISWVDDSLSMTSALASHLMTTLFDLPSTCSEDLAAQMESDLLIGGVHQDALTPPASQIEQAIEQMNSLVENIPSPYRTPDLMPVASLGEPMQPMEPMQLPRQVRRASLQEQKDFLDNLVEVTLCCLLISVTGHWGCGCH